MLDLVNCTRKGTGFRWLVGHTVATFSCVTINPPSSVVLQSTCYIDNRKFPGIDGFHLGPLGYGVFSYYNVIIVTPNIITFLNQWLVGGLLVRPAFNSFEQVTDVDCPASRTVVRLSVAWITGSSLSRVSCIWPLLVCPRDLASGQPYFQPMSPIQRWVSYPSTGISYRVPPFRRFRSLIPLNLCRVQRSTRTRDHHQTYRPQQEF